MKVGDFTDMEVGDLIKLKNLYRHMAQWYAAKQDHFAIITDIIMDDDDDDQGVIWLWTSTRGEWSIPWWDRRMIIEHKSWWEIRNKNESR